MEIAQEIIDVLKSLKEENSPASYSHIKNILKNQRIAVPCIQSNAKKIARYSRHNKGEEFFNSVDRLSYNKNILTIKEFQRCSEPGQGLFYCTDSLNEQAGIFELASVLRNTPDSTEEIMTVSAWGVLEPLKLALILPPSKNYGVNKEFDAMQQLFYDFDNTPEYEELKKLVEFLAIEFTLDKEKDHTNYLITCAFSNYIRETFPNVDGIMYPSVKSEFQDTNIVLWEHTVDNKLQFLGARKRGLIRTPQSKEFIEKITINSKSVDRATGEIFW